MDIQLDNLSISDLVARYSLESRQAIYNRLRHLGITPTKGRITADELTEMDALHGFLQQPGAKMSAYPVPSSTPSPHLINSPTPAALNLSTRKNQLSTGQQDLLLGLIEAIAIRLQPATPDPLAPHRQLEEAAQHNWILTTSQLQKILGVKPQAGDRLGFIFTKIGKVGREMGWRVEKQ